MDIALVDLSPAGQLRAGRLPRRVAQLLTGLGLYGASIGLMVRGRLGLAPWDVLHSGLARLMHVGIGQMVIIVSFAVLVAWIPLRERFGIGTLLNAVLVGLTASLTIELTPAPHALAVRAALSLAGIGICGLSTAMYIGAQFGRGPRDGLMTGLSRRTGRSLRTVRTALEATVVLGGVALSGSIGPATLVYALSIGPITQRLLPAWVIPIAAPT